MGYNSRDIETANLANTYPYGSWNKTDKTERLLRHIYTINLVLTFYVWFCMEGVSALSMDIIFHFMGWSTEFDVWGLRWGTAMLRLVCGVACWFYFYRYVSWNFFQILHVTYRAFFFRLFCALWISFGEFSQAETFFNICCVFMTITFLWDTCRSPRYFPYGYFGGNKGLKF